MDIDTIIEKSVIKFPRPLKVKKVEALLVYMAENISVNIEYNKSSDVKLTRESMHDEFSGFVPKKTYRRSLKGTITSTTDFTISESFSCEYVPNKYKQFDSIQFLTSSGNIPKYKEEKLLKFFEDIHEVVDKYFSKTNN